MCVSGVKGRFTWRVEPCASPVPLHQPRIYNGKKCAKVLNWVWCVVSEVRVMEGFRPSERAFLIQTGAGNYLKKAFVCLVYINRWIIAERLFPLVGGAD